MYKINDIFSSYQGEGVNIGKQAIFVRFSGCNLWSGKEEDRQNAICKFCDTDFFIVKYIIETKEKLLEKLEDRYKDLSSHELLVFTGGEPLLQLSSEDIKWFSEKVDMEVAIETNGTIPLDDDILNYAHIAVSPKIGSRTKLKVASEIKLVVSERSSENKWEMDKLIPMIGKIQFHSHREVPVYVIPEHSKDQEYIVTNPEYEKEFKEMENEVLLGNEVLTEPKKEFMVLDQNFENIKTFAFFLKLFSKNPYPIRIGIQAHKYWKFK